MIKKISIIIIFFFILKINEYFYFYNKTNGIKNITKIPVFAFHRLVPDDVKRDIYPDIEWVGSINIFEEMMKYIYQKGFKTINTEELYKWYMGEIEFNKKTLLITFDDGFYEDYYLVYPIIKKYNLKATSFVVGNYIQDKTNPYNKYNKSHIGMDAIDHIRKEYPDFEFQSHSFNMHFFSIKNRTKRYRINTMTYKELQIDALKMKRIGFTTMAYPYGNFNKNVKEILKDMGYLMAFRFWPSQYASRNSDRFAIPRIKLNGDATIDTLKSWLNY